MIMKETEFIREYRKRIKNLQVVKRERQNAETLADILKEEENSFLKMGSFEVKEVKKEYLIIQEQKSENNCNK